MQRATGKVPQRYGASLDEVVTKAKRGAKWTVGAYAGEPCACHAVYYYPLAQAVGTEKRTSRVPPRATGHRGRLAVGERTSEREARREESETSRVKK